MKKLIIILFLSFLLIGCDTTKNLWEDIKNLQLIKPSFAQLNETLNSTSNQTSNETSNVSIPMLETIRLNEPYPNIFIVSSHSILVVDNNKSYVIDAPKDNPKILNYLNDFNIKELEFIAVTTNKEEHIGSIPNIAIKSIPKIVYDNGIINEYKSSYMYRLDKYNSYWNRTATSYITVLDDFKDGDFEFFVPYSRGLSTINEENSIVVYYKKKFLYMSDCYGGCEQKLPPINTEFLVLANDGKCPTNTFDFILGTGAKYVIGEEICSDLKENLDFIGIKQLLLNQTGTIEIIGNKTIYENQ